jgi:predicted phosphoadenosine phosphosulfate sulfurtransferase
LNGIPDEVPIEIFNLVPSYKKICLAILKNDYTLKTLGFTPPKSKFYSELKRIEISKRYHKVVQIELF